nr:carbon-phosphorus lyase complex subunit PhnI [Tabrizicola sp.]
MYVAVKGGERAIDNAHGWLAEERRGDLAVPELTVAQIREQMKLAVNRVMAEGSLYDPDLAALAIKQARGDLIEAVFLSRAYRTTLPRLAASQPVDTWAMAVDRRISATFKDLPGGQGLGPTFDYTHRLLDFALMAEGGAPIGTMLPTPIPSPPGGKVPCPSVPHDATTEAPPSPRVGEGWGGGARRVPHVTGFLNRDGLIEEAPVSDATPPDL